MKKLLIIFLILFVSCASPWTSIGTKTESIEFILNQAQVDSLISADSLKLDMWITAPLKDYETDKEIVKRIYIKDSVIYTLLKTDSCYYLEKRTNKL